MRRCVAANSSRMRSGVALLPLLLALGLSGAFGAEDYRHWFKAPIMGWNVFNDIGCGSEAQITNAALTFIANGLRDAGYRWIQLDAGCSLGRLLIAHTCNRFVMPMGTFLQTV